MPPEAFNLVVETFIVVGLVIVFTTIPMVIILYRICKNTPGKKGMVSMAIPGDGIGRVRLLPGEITFVGISLPVSGPARAENGTILPYGTLVRIVERGWDAYLVRAITEETRT